MANNTNPAKLKYKPQDDQKTKTNADKEPDHHRRLGRKK
jgi:hypothetical protein